jgi:hypothetical protein
MVMYEAPHETAFDPVPMPASHVSAGFCDMGMLRPPFDHFRGGTAAARSTQMGGGPGLDRGQGSRAEAGELVVRQQPPGPAAGRAAPVPPTGSERRRPRPRPVPGRTSRYMPRYRSCGPRPGSAASRPTSSSTCWPNRSGAVRRRRRNNFQSASGNGPATHLSSPLSSMRWKSCLVQRDHRGKSAARRPDAGNGGRHLSAAAGTTSGSAGRSPAAAG